MTEKKKVTVPCPICKKKTVWKENPHRPFCSERCRMMDLGNWADGSYSVESNSQPDFEDDQK